MVFNLAVDKMVIVEGAIITIQAGEFKTTDKDLIEALKGCIGVDIISEPKSKK